MPRGLARRRWSLTQSWRTEEDARVSTDGARLPRLPGHIAYWFHADKVAFAGDTLFSIGCGRVIEGTMEQMWNSLTKLRDLPGDTRVYCGHEYTLANIKFAQTIEPDNKALTARAAQAARQIAAGQHTVPTTIDEEKAANVFLRADVPAVAAAVGLAGKPAAEVFAEIRTRKNKF